MAVPRASCPPGPLSMRGMAQETLFGTYGSGSPIGAISLYDMINSGSASSGQTYPNINTSSTPNPVTRDGSNSLELPNVVDVMGTFDGSLYYDSRIGDARNLAVGDYLYLNAALTEAYCGTGTFTQNGSTGDSKYHCDNTEQWYFVINAGGASSDFGKINQSNACA